MSFISNFRNQTMKIEENQLVPMFIGMQLYLYISFTRGFLAAIIVYVVDTLKLPQYVGALCAIVPVITFPFIIKYLDLNRGIKLSLAVWVLAIVSPFLGLNLILFIIGLTISYANFSQLGKVNVSKLEFPLIGAYFLFLDNLFRGLGSGNDPTIAKHLLIIFIILITAFVFFNLPNVPTSNNTPRDSEVRAGGYYLGIVITMSVYFMYFGNSGMIVFHMGLNGALALTVYFLCNLIAFAVLLYYPEVVSQPIIIISSAIVMLGVVFLTWMGMMISILWWFGLFGNILLLTHYIQEISKMKPSQPWFLAGSFVVNLGLLFMSITKDGTIFPLILGVLAVLPLAQSFPKEHGGAVS